MSTCNRCGGGLIIRYINGQRTPISSGCDCWDYSGDYASSESSSSANFQQYSMYENTYISDHSAKDYCRPTKCPKCGSEVFFIQHNGGSVWVDELGWPWPKHACFDAWDGGKSLRALRSDIAKPQIKNKLGLVIRLQVHEGNPTKTTLAINTYDSKGVCIILLRDARILIGQLVALNLESKVLYSPYSIEYSIVQTKENPDVLGLPSKWLSNCWNYIDKNKSPSDEKTEPVSDTKNKIIKCQECGVKLNHKNLRKHLKKVHGVD